MENKTRILISYIKSPSKYGESLLNNFQKWVSESLNRSRLPDGTEAEIVVEDVVEQVQSEASDKKIMVLDCQEASLLACLHSDIIIFDGSIEDEDTSQYRFGYELMKHLDFVLIVSRTELPYNFEGARKGGAPSWIQIGEERSGIMPENAPEQSNKDILNWLKKTILQLELPRSDKQEANISTQIVSVTNAFIEVSKRRLADLRKSQPSLFISYLSKDYPRLKAIFPEIAVQTGIPIECFHYFAPGKVAKELMTERRRWEIVSVTDREIRKTDCIVVFETEGYHQSWWTMGEQMSISYEYQDHWSSCPDVYVAKADVNSIHWVKLSTPEQKQAYFPHITEEQKHRLARRFANSDPNEAAFELDPKLVRQAAQPALIKASRALMNGVALSFAEKTGILGEILGESSNPGERRFNFEKNISQAMESEFSYTHTSDFRKIRIIECPYCRQEFSKPLTIDDFIQLDMPYVYRVEDNELIEKNGRLILDSKCPRHPGTIALRRNKCYSRFIQPRGKEKLNDKIVLIEQVDRIEFI